MAGDVSRRALERWACGLALALGPGCYTGADRGDAEPTAGGDGVSDYGVADGDDDDDDDDDDGPDDPQGLCQGEIDVGVSALRRLTREQYDNVIADLLGLDADARSRFDADERVGPFTSNSIIPVTERLVEQYMGAAEDLAQQAVAADLDALLPCEPETTGEIECAREFIATFGRRALRRPLSPAEVTIFEGVYELGAEQDGFTSGIELVIEAMLQSPDFLYLLELMPADGSPDDLVELGGYELASRLSFLVWHSMPDDELLDAAESLGDPDVLEAQTRRLLEHPRARQTIATFHIQWVGLHGVDDLFKDPEMFPEFDDATKTAMRDETARFAQHVFFEGDGRLETLLTAPYSFPGPELFDIYGITPPADQDPDEPVMLDPAQRGGILTQPGFLAAHAHHNQTSPVHRGVAIRRNFLCQELPAPPPDVDNTPPPIDPNSTTRERFEQHKSDPACAGCHFLIDDLGLAYEHYDAVGAWRTMDGIGEVDASGEMHAAQESNGAFYGALELGEILAGSSVVQQCVTQQWFRFALGRSPADEDECAQTQIMNAFEASDHDLRELLVAVVMSPSFRYLRVAEGGE